MGDLSPIAHLAFPSALNILFLFYPCSLEELIYLQLAVVERLSRARLTELEFLSASLSAISPLCFCYRPAFILSAIFGTVYVDLSYFLLEHCCLLVYYCAYSLWFNLISSFTHHAHPTRDRSYVGLAKRHLSQTAPILGSDLFPAPLDRHPKNLH